MDNQSILTLIIAALSCTGFWAFIQSVAARRTKKRTASEEALLAILHEMIYPMLEVVVTRPGNVVGYEEMDRIRKLYTPYKGLGGNGTVKARFHIAETYKRVPDERIYHELEIEN